MAEEEVLERKYLPTDLAERAVQGSEEAKRSGDQETTSHVSPSLPVEGQSCLSFQEAKRQAVRSFETDFLSLALKENRGNITKTASQLGMKRQSLQQKLKELEIDAMAFRHR